jgi:hypothetical protein
MTMQILDSVLFDGRPWSLCHYKCDIGLPENSDLGIHSTSHSTACWRGRVDTYGAEDGVFALKRVDYTPIRSRSPPGRPQPSMILGGSARRIDFMPPRLIAASGLVVIAEEYVPRRGYRQDANTFMKRVILSLDKGSVVSSVREFGVSDVPWGEDPDAYRERVAARIVEADTAEVRRQEVARIRKVRSDEMRLKFSHAVEEEYNRYARSNPSIKDGDLVDGVCVVCGAEEKLRVFLPRGVLCYRCYFKW